MFKVTLRQSQNFSTLSKDKNLIHLSKRFASKFFFKKPITHGINTILLALNKYLNKDKKLILIKYIKINFKNFILLDEIFRIKIIKNKILIFNNLNTKIEIFIRKKLIKKKDNLYKELIFKKKNKHWNNYLLNFELRNHLLSISKIIGSIRPGNGSLIHKIETKYNKSLHNKNIIFKRIIKNFWLLNYSEKHFKSSIVTSKLLAYEANKQTILISKKIKKKIFKKKILIIGSSGDIGQPLKKGLKNSGCLLFTYSFRINENSPNLTATEKKKLQKMILKIKPNFIFYLSSPKIYHGNKNNKALVKLYKIIYCKFLSYLLNVLCKFKIQTKIFYPSSIALNNSNKFKYLNAYISAKRKAEIICEKKKYKKLITYFRLPQLKTRSNYNILGHYEGKNLTLMSKYLDKFF